MFDEILKETFDEREKRILNLWNSTRVFERSVEEKEGAPVFTFYDGPPFATGLPHYGHLLAGTIKDVVPRYKTMKGYQVKRRFGWDCHGLPIENEIEKAHNLTGAQSIEAFGIPKFNEECRSIVLRYTEEWKSIVNRMGRFVDFNQTYRTMDKNFMESVWWVFKELYNKGLVYEGYKVMPFSAKLGTPLSNFEASENYKDVDDPALTVGFVLEEDPTTEILAWTTTPWTLISNMALMVGPQIAYVKIQEKKTQKKYILAKERLLSLFKTEDEYVVLETFMGKEMDAWRYRPLFPYFAQKEGAFRVILEDSVSTEEGTGVVHAAPAFGEVDFYACKKASVPLVNPVDNNGRYTSEIQEYQGLFVKDADKAIMRRLKEEGRVFHQATCRHRYPFCWRSDTPLIYKAVTTWFVSVETIKDKMLAANEQIHWTPGHLKYGRFGKWLEGARDWAISRNRYWGTPIPIWRAEDGELLVLGSIAELEELTGEAITDLHRHFIDEIVIEKKGKRFRRIPEVFDCWFESGSMPYAQNHYPFEGKEAFEKAFPADFIGEGLDQTRGWFYTLTVLAAALFDKPAFKNVIVNGIVLAEDGAKMSKRLRNYPDPMDVVQKYGADAVRLYMMLSGAVKADDLRFQQTGVELVLRQVMIPLFNAFSFFVTYARIYQFHPEKGLTSPKLTIDRWIFSKLHKLIHDVEEGMDDYDLSSAVEPFVGFVDDLTNWYIRRSRRRFWDAEDTEERRAAFSTLYVVLLELSKIAAPFIPFMSEAIYQQLKTSQMKDSVHLSDYPKYQHEVRDRQLEEAMGSVMQTVSVGHALRKEHQLKVRQPLKNATLITASQTLLELLSDYKELIADELNVKEVIFSQKEEEFVHLVAKPNFRILGKKLGKSMPLAQKAIGSLERSFLEKLQKGESIHLTLENNVFEITSEEVEVIREVKEGMIAANTGEITIALDTEMTESLLDEGLMREVINKINTMRREMNFDVVDRIEIVIESTKRVERVVRLFEELISEEVLAVLIKFEPCSGTSWDLNGEMATIQLIKVPNHQVKQKI
jgi:isoleucyl-tRNA synthetase